jgi:hypothetical protein
MGKYDKNPDEGTISKWNEGDLKSLRLHEAQEIINYAKRNPLKKENGEYNFQMWIEGIDILYGECDSKYSTKEMEEVDEVRKKIDYLLNIEPPISITIVNGLGINKNKLFVDSLRWERLKQEIKAYERMVKRYNDKHGWSTANVSSEWESLI